MRRIHSLNGVSGNSGCPSCRDAIGEHEWDQHSCARKSIDQLICRTRENAEVRLKKSLGWLSLTSLGIGAVIGSGIFTIIGTAIAGQKIQVTSILNAPLLEYLIYTSPSFGRPGAGPAIALSFVLVAIVCGFASVCYAELAAMIPIAGSAYTYTYATMGETHRLDHRLGSDSRIRCQQHGGERRVFRAHGGPARLVRRSSEPALDFSGLPAVAGCRICKATRLYGPGWHFGFNWPAFIIVMLLTVILVRGHSRVRGSQQHHGADENRGHSRLHHVCYRDSFIPPTGIPSRQTAGPAS